MNMTITEFNETLETMRKAYPFKDDKTRIISFYDLKSNSNNQIALCTVDEDTKTEITMVKEVERKLHEFYKG